MEVVVAILMFAIAVGAGALVIASIESNKPWAQDLARAYAVLGSHPATLDLPRKPFASDANDAVDADDTAPVPLHGRDADSVAANEQPRLVA